MIRTDDEDDWGPSLSQSLAREEEQKRAYEEKHRAGQLEDDDFANGTTPDLPRIMTFDEMHLSDHILRGIYSYGFDNPSPIQQLAIPAITSGRDIIAQAQSGTGKTGMMCIGILDCIEKVRLAHCRKHASVSVTPDDVSDLMLNPKFPKLPPTVLFISPNKVLAEQNYGVLSEFAIRMDPPVNIHIFKGGNTFDSDSQNAKTVDVIVGTTGRILDLVLKNKLNISQLSMIVMDEADEFLMMKPQSRKQRDTGYGDNNRRSHNNDEKFTDELYELLRVAPSSAQMVIVSATMPEEAIKRADKLTNNPVRILVKSEKLSLDGIRQFNVYVGVQMGRTEPQYVPSKLRQAKLNIFNEIFKRIPVTQTIIFVNRVEDAQYLAEELERSGKMVALLHAQLPWVEQRRAVVGFTKGDYRYLITTDLTARGFNVQSVSLVINFDVPSSENYIETYLHRIGRSGRYGRKGNSINFVIEGWTPRNSISDMSRISNIKKHYQCDIMELPDNQADFLI